jgi:hypothetical protein
MRRRAHVAAAGVLTLLAVSACSHDSGSKSGSAHGGQVAVPAQAGSRVYGSTAGLGASGAGTAALRPQQLSAADRVQANSALAIKLANTGARIRVAYLKVAIKGAANVAAKADEADVLAADVGGEVESDDRTSGRQASAMLQLRVPPEVLQSTLHKLSRLGHELARQLSTTDVTQQVADVNSRIVSARDSIQRLRLLYANAQKVRDVIQIENELSSREANLESLQARQRALARQTSLATINLTLVTAAKKAAAVHKPAKKRGGFVGGITRGWNGFVAAAVWVASAIGTVLPFAALALLLAVALRRWGWPRHRPAPVSTGSE